jgi:anti-anti-sigma factor
MEQPSESMRSTRLRLETTDLADGRVDVTVDGDVDMATSDYFRHTLMRLVTEPAVTDLVLDAGRLAFIDSNGVTVLVKVHRAARERGISFGITNTQDPVRGLLELLGVYDLLARVEAT